MLENRDNIRLVPTDKRNYLVLEPNYHTTKWFSENLLAIKNNKTKVKMNKPIYLGLSVLQISKVVSVSFGMIILNQSIRTKQNHVYIDADSFIEIKKTDDAFENIANDIEKRFDISNYETERPLPKLLKIKSYQNNEGRIRWKGYDRVCRAYHTKYL